MAKGKESSNTLCIRARQRAKQLSTPTGSYYDYQLITALADRVCELEDELKLMRKKASKVVNVGEKQRTYADGKR